MQVRRVTDLSDLSPQSPQWNLLTRGIPFRSWEWVSHWWANYGHEKELFLLAVVNSGGELIGAAPWFVNHNTLSGRTIEFIGTGEVCSDYLGLLAAPENEDLVAGAIADWLLSANQGASSVEQRWDQLHLNGIDKADCGMAKLVEQLVDGGSSVHRREGLNCWRIALPDSWTAYEELLSKSHRKQVRRVDRRLLQTGKAVLKTVRTPDELESGLRILVDLHQKRRQSLHQPGCFASARFRNFLSDTARSLLPRGEVQLHWLELDGRPVAAEIHWVGGGVVYAYQAGVDPELLDEEPGRMITIATLKKAIADGRSKFDFLRGDEPYKAHFRAEPNSLLELRIIAPKGLAQLRHGVWLAGDAVKGLIKSGLNLSGMR